MALNDVFELAVRQTYAGIVVFNVFHLQDIRGDGDAQHLADNFRDGRAMSVWRGWVGSSHFFESCVTTQLYPYVLNQGQASIQRAGAGEFGTMPAPVVAAVVTWQTGVRGKRYRGRSYFASVCNGFQGAYWDGASMQRLTTIALGFLEQYGPDGLDPTYRLGVWSRVNGMLPDHTSSLAGFTPVSGATVRNYVCSMGTRRAGHGI